MVKWLSFPLNGLGFTSVAMGSHLVRGNLWPCPAVHCLVTLL